MSIGLLGQKIGMTSVYDANGRLHPVTVIAVGDNALLRRLTNDNDGYSAVQVGFGSQKESRVSKAELGVFKSVMKKHNFDGQGAAHGSKTHRRNGAVGNRSTPGRIWKNMGMPGHLGDERVTVQRSEEH